MRNFTIKLDDFEVQGAFNLSQADNTAYLDKQTSVFLMINQIILLHLLFFFK